MKEFFRVTDLDRVLELKRDFPVAGCETIALTETAGRVLAEDIVSDADLPGFARATMDGFAVRAGSTFGASDGAPAWLDVAGNIAMAEVPQLSVGPGEAARIPTGGMLPEGADSVVMIEHTGQIDDSTVEIYRSVAPGQHVVQKDEDFAKSETVLKKGAIIRPQEAGLLAAFGKEKVKVFQKPVVGIISSGDEIAAIDEEVAPGRVRDINSYSLSAQVGEAGGIPKLYGIVKDSFDDLFRVCDKAVMECDLVMISGGSSVGTRDFTIDVLNALPKTEILVHGITISPGKPTILAKSSGRQFWGLPGHVVSAMVVFEVVVKPFIEHTAGLSEEGKRKFMIPAVLSRNLPSAQGRCDFTRVRLTDRDGVLYAEPVMGKSGLLNTMIKADGLIEIGMNSEGLEKGADVQVRLI